MLMTGEPWLCCPQSGKLGSASNLSKEGSGSGYRGLSSVSMAAGTGSAAPLEEEGPRGYTRSGFVVVPLDGNFRGEAVSVCSHCSRVPSGQSMCLAPRAAASSLQTLMLLKVGDTHTSTSPSGAASAKATAKTSRNMHGSGMLSPFLAFNLICNACKKPERVNSLCVERRACFAPLLYEVATACELCTKRILLC